MELQHHRASLQGWGRRRGGWEVPAPQWGDFGGLSTPKASGCGGDRRGERRSPARSSSGLSWWRDPTAPGAPGRRRWRSPQGHAGDSWWWWRMSSPGGRHWRSPSAGGGFREMSPGRAGPPQGKIPPTLAELWCERGNHELPPEKKPPGTSQVPAGS